MNDTNQDYSSDNPLTKVIEFLLALGIKCKVRENNSSILPNVLIAENKILIDPLAEYTDVLREASHLAIFQETAKNQGGGVGDEVSFSSYKGAQGCADKEKAEDWLSNAVAEIFNGNTVNIY